MNRSQRRAQARTQHTGFVTLPPIDSRAFNRMARPHCTDCHRTGLRWMSPAELLVTVPGDQLSDAQEVVAQVGPTAEAWLCPSCNAFGAFGGFQSF